MRVTLVGCRDLAESGRLARHASTLCFSFPWSGRLCDVKNVGSLCILNFIVIVSRPADGEIAGSFNMAVDQFRRTIERIPLPGGARDHPVISNALTLAWIIRAVVGRQL